MGVRYRIVPVSISCLCFLWVTPKNIDSLLCIKSRLTTSGNIFVGLIVVVIKCACTENKSFATAQSHWPNYKDSWTVDIPHDSRLKPEELLI